ncbi:AsmA-like C-terminal region-containing protein [Persicobacter psychrovividus]|uniref:AsmA family protein n=1 Tax=Persicobacter psychrovividus TaxID=387638 RepID=A0ABM7VI18_9BACT|nr:hypothetical protein PEPS_29070 [Persicobacter psychrovividus]
MIEKRTGKTFLKVVGIGLIVVAVLLLGLVLALPMAVQPLAQKGLEQFNRDLQGKIEVQQVQMASLSSFPLVKVQMNNLSVHELDTLGEPKTDAVIRLGQVRASVNVWKLLSNELLIDSLSLKNGVVDYRIAEDSTINLNKIFMASADSLPADSSSFDMQVKVNAVAVDSVSLTYNNDVSWEYMGASIDRLRGNAQYSLSESSADFQLDGSLDSLQNIAIALSRQPISMAVDAAYDSSGLVSVNHANLKVKSAKLDAQGIYEMGNKGLTNFHCQFDDEGASVLYTIFDGMLHGENDYNPEAHVRFSVNLKGEKGAVTPAVNATVDVDSVSFKNKDVNLKMIAIQMKGETLAGEDFMHGKLDIDRLFIQSESAYFNTKGLIENIEHPKMTAHWDGKVDLSVFAPAFIMVKMGDVKGDIVTNGDCSVTIADKMNMTGHANMGIKNLHFFFEPLNKTLDKANLEVAVSPELAQIKEFSVKMGKSSMVGHASIKDPLKMARHESDSVDVKVQFSSPYFALADFLPYDSAKQNLVDKWKLENLMIDMNMATTFKGFKNPMLPIGRIVLNDLTLHPHGLKEIQKVRGELVVSKEDIHLDHLKGLIGRSDFHLNGVVDNYASLARADENDSLHVAFNFTSGKVRVKDILKYEKTYFVPRTYRKEKLLNFIAQGRVTVPNRTLLANAGMPSVVLHMDTLAGKTTLLPMAISDVKFSMVSDSIGLVVDQLQGKIGRSDFYGKAAVKWPKAEGYLPEGMAAIGAKYLDFNELARVELPEEDTTDVAGAEGDSESTSLSSMHFPNFTFDVNIDTLHFMRANYIHINGKLKSSANKSINLSDLHVDFADGRAKLNGGLDFSDSTAYTMDGHIELKDVALNKIDFQMAYEEDTIDMRKNFAGNLNASIESTLKMAPDFSLNIPKSKAVIQADITKGSIIDFGPLAAMAKFFSNKDLNHIRFAEMQNTFRLEDNTFFIPRMNIASTIGQIYFSGAQNLDGQLDYGVEVPFKLIRGVGWNMLVKRKKKAGKEDEIMTDTGGKYVHVSVSGNMDDYNIKLGKKHKQ